MPTTKTAKSPGWGAKPKKPAAADAFVDGEFAPLNVRLPRALVVALKAHCARKGVKIQALVERVITAELTR